MVTGKFLGVKVVSTEGGTEEKDDEVQRQVRGAVLLDPGEASREASEFCFTNTAVSGCQGNLDLCHNMLLGFVPVCYLESKIFPFCFIGPSHDLE